ncbi:hypothetical protein FRB95_013555 [Tulasnella sp. JGI-2019a]|nr:hypothetical protein FRB95_013555 [Tulasnella sp. JGI-2019a]
MDLRFAHSNGKDISRGVADPDGELCPADKPRAAGLGAQNQQSNSFHWVMRFISLKNASTNIIDNRASVRTAAYKERGAST